MNIRAIYWCKTAIIKSAIFENENYAYNITINKQQLA